MYGLPLKIPLSIAYIILLLLVYIAAMPPTASYAADLFEQAFAAADKRNWQIAVDIARKSSNSELITYINWRRYRNSDNRPTAEDIIKFIQNNQFWPDTRKLLNRAAEALLLQGAHVNAVFSWGKLMQKYNLLPDNVDINNHKQLVRFLLRDRWQHGQFNAIEQSAVIKRFGNLLTVDDHIARADNLLWHGDIHLASKLRYFLPPAYRKLIQARIALISNQRGVDAAIAAVPNKLKKHLGLLYDRMCWRARKKRYDGVREILQILPDNVPYPNKWWRYRVQQVRLLIQEKQYKEALKLLMNHGQKSGASLAEALWLRGWIKLNFLHMPAAAYEDFYKLYHNVQYPVSLGRGAYWAGVAAHHNGNKEIANNWFNVAAKYQTSFYGQMAKLIVTKNGITKRTVETDLSPVQITTHTPPSIIKFTDDKLLSTIAILAKYQQKLSVKQFLLHIAKQQQRAEEFIALARFAKSINYPHIMLQIAKKAMQIKHLWLPEISHPIVKLPINLLESALVLAIIRQESEFNPNAVSRANARGMMQLLPTTAKLVAAKKGIKYNFHKLLEPEYNILLGTHYLADLLDSYDGSYILAIAAYNAGPGNVNRWVQKIGRPIKGNIESQLSWIEQIPFAETRNYVQRVLENLHLYRHLLGSKSKMAIY